MVKELGKVTTLSGKSGKDYEFNLWSFDEFEDIKNTFKGGGLYLFTRRVYSENEYWHHYIYLGETEDYYTRYNSHHKEVCIKNYESNCIGFYSMPNATEEERKAAEDDLLDAYNFPCNSANN